MGSGCAASGEALLRAALEAIEALVRASAGGGNPASRLANTPARLGFGRLAKHASRALAAIARLTESDRGEAAHGVRSARGLARDLAVCPRLAVGGADEVVAAGAFGQLRAAAGLVRSPAEETLAAVRPCTRFAELAWPVRDARAVVTHRILASNGGVFARLTEAWPPHARAFAPPVDDLAAELLVAVGRAALGVQCA